MRRLVPFLTLCALLAAPRGLTAQWGTGPVPAAMGGAGMVFATGLDAVELNPANLAFSRGWTVSLVDVGAAGLLTGTTLGDLVEIATAGGDGDPTVVSRLPDSGFRLFSVAEGFALSRGATAADVPTPGASVPTVGIAWGPVGLRLRNRVLVDASLSREIADLTVNGFNPERIREYAVRETGFRVASFTEMTLGFGFALGRLGLGGGVRFVQGHRLAQGRFFEPVIDLDAETLSVTGVSVEAPGGTGWGLDLGMALDLGGGVRMSLAGQNVVQRMTWDDALRSHQAVFTDDDFDSAELADLLDRFDDTLLDPSAAGLPVLEAARGLFAQAYFPAVFRAGVGWASEGGTRAEIVASTVTLRGRQRAPWEERVSAGVEQRAGFLVLRAGYARAEDGLTALSGGLGFRLGPVRLDLAAGSLSGSLDGIAYDGVQGSLGLSLAGGGA